MATTAQALEKLAEAKLPYITVLTHPTTGGVAASLAMQADIILAEPKALIGFTGPRVIEQTIKKKLPQGFQRAEFCLEHGSVDAIVSRADLAPTLYKLSQSLMSHRSYSTHRTTHKKTQKPAAALTQPA